MEKNNIFQNRKKFFKKVSFKFFEISFISSLIKDSCILLFSTALNLIHHVASRKIHRTFIRQKVKLANDTLVLLYK